MSKFKRKMGKRILAYILSGAMIMSNMTAFASETSSSTGGGYYEEAVEADDIDSEDAAETVESEEASQSEEAVETEESSDEKDDEKESSVEATETETSDDEQTSETESSLSKETEDEEDKVSEPEDNKEEELRTEWDFKNDASLVMESAIEGGTGTLAGLEIDATSGKFQTRSGDWALFNNGAIIKVPVSGKCNVTVTAYAASYSVDGKAAKSATETFECEGTDGYVTITANAGAQPYLGSIKVEPVEEDEEGELRTEWDFKNDASLVMESAIEGGTGTLARLEIDATSGKFQTRSGDWALFNNGAIIKVPVSGKCNVTVTAYATSYSVDGKAAKSATETFECEGTNGYVTITANTGEQPYLGSIKVEPVGEVPDTTYTSWNFSDSGFQTEANKTSVSKYNGLKFESAKAYNSKYLSVENGGKVSIPVAGNSTVTVKAQYGHSFYFADESDDVKAGVTDGTICSYNYEYTGEIGYVTLTATATTYLTEITVEPVGEVPDTTYTSWNFSDSSFQTEANKTSVSEYNGLKLENAKAHNKQYLYIGNGGKVSIPVAGSSTVTVKAQYGNSFYFADNSDDVKIGSGETISTYDYTYTGEIGYVTLTVTGTTYLTEITVEPVAEEELDEANNFKEWLDDLAVDGTVKTGTYEYGGGNVTLVGEKETQFTVEPKAANVERDGGKHNGYKAGERHGKANEIPSIPTAGEGCCVEFESKTTGMFKMYFWSTSFLRVWDFDTETGMRNGYTDSETAADFYAFNTKPGHTYVMSTTGKTNNMAFIGYEYVQNMDVEVTVAVNNVDADESALSSLELTLTDAALGTDKGVVKQNTTSVKLLKNHTYTITSNDGGVKALVSGEDSFTATGDAVTFDLYNVPNVKLTGEITGTGVGTVTKLTFENMVNGSLFEAEIKDDNTYSCDMKPGEYNTSVETTNGGKTYDRVSVKSGEENVNEVYVEVPDPSKARKYAPADIAELESTGSITLRSDNGGDVLGQAEATITVPVTGRASVTIETYYQAAYKVNDTEYTNTSKDTGKNQADTMTVEGDFTINVTGTTYFRAISVVPVVAFKSELSVPGDYDTLNEAFDAIAAMENRPEGEEGRVTVTLNKDIREQTVVNAPYVTLKGNNHTVDWYYGVGTLYYSVDPSTGLYNERLARDRYSSAEGNGNLWGGAFIVRGDNFIAEDTIFKNTYNYELTEEEKTDIAGSTLSVSRLDEGADVAASAYKERSNAFYIEADNIECYNCKILSSQDTLGRNGSTNNGYHTYFKNCVIGGNVDYICGEFAAVFDNCELQWKSLSDKGNDKVGYIVAPKTNPYVFRNCKVTLDNSTVTGVLGYYGRTWGAGSKAAFINTETNGYINADGWGEMNSGDGTTAVFKEYNNTKNGEAFVTTGSFCSAENQTADAVKDYIDTDEVSVVNTVLGGWTPAHYSYEFVVETPEASPAAGAVAVGTKVILTSKTEGAAIYYTTNGDVPTTGSKLYTDAEPIIITEAVTIKAIAVKEGFTDSEVATFEYTISDKPVDPDDPDKPVDPDVPVVTTIQLSDCAIAVPSILADSKKNPNNETSTSVVYYTSKDKDGNPTNPVRFAEGLDYKVQWNGLKAGTENVYTVTITGLGRAVDQYRIDTASTVTKEYKVFDKSDKSVVNLSKAKITLDSSAKNAVYTGYGITPAVTEVKIGKEVIPATKYKVSYKSNINAGKATVIVTADSDAEYAEGESFIIGSKTVNFTIKKAAINKNQVTVTALDRNGKEFGSEPYAYRGIDAVEISKLSVASSEGKTLKENVDYTVTYKNNRKAGKATATIKGIGSNISGSLNIPFTITPLDIGIDSPYKISTVQGSLQYSPSGAKLGYIRVYNDNDEIYLEEGVDFKVTYTYADKKTKAAGTTVDFVGTGINACKGSFSNKDTVFTIQKAYFDEAVYLSNAVIVDETKSALTGDKLQKALEKAAVVYDAYGTKLKVKKDYSVTSTTIDGKDVITISPAETVKDNYYGEYNSCSYYYYRAKNIAKLKKVEFAKDYVLLYDGRNPVELTADDIKALGTYEFVLGKDVEIVEGSYKNNYKAGTASVTIRGISQNGYYGTKTIKFKIKEA